jgi:hypothetical protein
MSALESHSEHESPTSAVTDPPADSLDDLTNQTEQLALEAGGSNKPLPTPQQRSIRNLISKVQIEIDELDREISQFLNTLGAKRNQMAARLERYRVAVAPHKNIPSEVLGNIFIHHLANNPLNIGLPEKGAHYHDKDLSLMAKSWVILHICKRWRQVALDDPRVWSSLQIYYGSLNSTTEDKSAVAFELLSNSGDTSLSLSLHVKQKFPDSKRATNPIISLLLPNARRIGNLVITGFPREWLYPLFDLPTGQLGSLETLDLEFSVAEQRETLSQLTASPSTAFESAPHLRKVRLNSDKALMLSLDYFSCPWSQMTDIRFSNIMIHVFDAAEILYDTLNLTHCELSVWVRVEETKTESDLLNVAVRALPSLQTMILHVPNSDVCLVLFAPFFFPALSRLEIMGQVGQGSADCWYSAVIALILRSKCTVEIFSTTLAIPIQAFEPLFECMPGLVSLHILLASRISSSALKCMSRGELLTKLKILDCRVESFDAFLDYLESCLNLETEAGGVRDATIFVEPQLLDHNVYNRFESLQPKLNGRQINLQSNQMGVVMLPKRTGTLGGF